MCVVARRFWQTPAKQISLRAEGERACTALRRIVSGDGGSILPYNLYPRQKASGGSPGRARSGGRFSEVEYMVFFFKHAINLGFF